MADAAAKRRRTCIGGGISALPEHVLHRIFSRVGNLKDLFMFAVTCRRWLRRFTDPAFLRELCLCLSQGEGHRARLLGFFLQQTRFDRRKSQMVETRMTQRTSDFAPTFLPGPGSPLGPPARALTSFVSDDDDGTFNYAEPLAARRGILLLQLAPRTPKEATCHLFALCNPITRERHVLPPLEWSLGGSDVRTYAIITAADTDSGNHDENGKLSTSLSGSQLLLTTSRAQIAYADVHLHSYSAATRSWSTPTMFLDGFFSLVGERSAVVHQGAAHWLCIDKKKGASGGGDSLHKLSVELATSRVSLTKLPIRGGGTPLLCISREGKLVVASVYPQHVTVWTQQAGDDEGGDDDTHAAWPRTAAFRIRRAAAPPNVHWLFQNQEKWFNFNRGSMLVMYRSSGVFIFDIEKKVVEKVMDSLLGKPDLTTCVAYEMDLVEFFTLQLGGVPVGLGTDTEY